MKKLFIYFSLTDNGNIVAETLKEKGYDIRKIKIHKKYPDNKLLMILSGGYKATFNKKDKLLDFDNNIIDYDKIVIGSPIWNDRISAPINSVLSLLDLKDKDISFVFYSASGKGNHAIEKVKNLYGAKSIILKEPKTNKEELKKLKI